MGAAPTGRDDGRWFAGSAALLWGLQFAFLNPTLALLLVTLFHAGAAQVGWALAIYNAGGFAASVVLPAYADRTGGYLKVMVVCGCLTLALVGLLAVAPNLPIAVLGLLVLGGPAGVGGSLLFAHLKHAGAGPAQIVRTRAIVSLAWVGGPPLATLVMGAFGNRSVLVAIGAVAAGALVTTAAMMRAGGAAGGGRAPVGAQAGDGAPTSRWLVAVVVAVFVVLQATNSAAVSIMSLFVTRTLGLPVAWAGVTLGVAAGLEIPALLLLARLNRRFGDPLLIVTGCVAGVAYYTAMVWARGPVVLLGLQALNAWFYAVVAGVGLSYFQALVPRPGLAAGLYSNAARLGAILSGPLIGLAALSTAYRGVFGACAALTVAALVVSVLLARGPGRRFRAPSVG